MPPPRAALSGPSPLSMSKKVGVAVIPPAVTTIASSFASRRVQKTATRHVRMWTVFSTLLYYGAKSFSLYRGHKSDRINRMPMASSAANSAIREMFRSMRLEDAPSDPDGTDRARSVGVRANSAFATLPNCGQEIKQ